VIHAGWLRDKNRTVKRKESIAELIKGKKPTAMPKIAAGMA
jgi:hypothetical protein